MDDLDGRAAAQTERVTDSSKGNETPVLTIAARQDFTSDGDTSEGTSGDHGMSDRSVHDITETISDKKRDSPKAHNGVGGCVIPAVVFSLTELSDTDRRQADVAAAGETEKQGVNNEQRQTAPGRKP